jgi:repressor LexA
VSGTDTVTDSHHSIETDAVASFTRKQGQYLAFIYYYTKIDGRPPSEADMERYFKVTAPSVHQMVITLERLGLISRTPGQGRSIELLLSRDELPDLD